MESFLIPYLGAVKKFAVFNGRARRKEFWTFTICNWIIGAVIGILTPIPILGVLFRIVGILFSIIIFVPSIAVGIRRLHDTNKSGLLILLSLAPVIGAIILLIFFAQDGTPGDNQYGSDPKGY